MGVGPVPGEEGVLKLRGRPRSKRVRVVARRKRRSSLAADESSFQGQTVKFRRDRARRARAQADQFLFRQVPMPSAALATACTQVNGTSKSADLLKTHWKDSFTAHARSKRGLCPP